MRNLARGGAGAVVEIESDALDKELQNSEGRDSTSMSNSDEPNFVIYNLIKEIDFLVENNNMYGSSASPGDSKSLLSH